MSVDTPGPYHPPCSEEASDSGNSSPTPAVHGPEENDSCLQMSAAEKLRTETGKKSSRWRTKLIWVREGSNGWRLIASLWTVYISISRWHYRPSGCPTWSFTGNILAFKSQAIVETGITDSGKLRLLWCGFWEPKCLFGNKYVTIITWAWCSQHRAWASRCAECCSH